MSDTPAYLKNLRALSKAAPTMNELEALEAELYLSPSDRATVVMFGSFIEYNLMMLISSSIRNDAASQGILEFNNAVGTFGARIAVAYAFRLIGPASRADLDLIRQLRNTFAHSRMPFGFNTKEVSEACKHLRMPDLQGTHLPSNYLEKVPHADLAAAIDLKNPKTRFLTTCHALVYRMQVKARGPQAGDTVFIDDEPLP